LTGKSVAAFGKEKAPIPRAPAHPAV